MQAVTQSTVCQEYNAVGYMGYSVTILKVNVYTDNP